MARAVERFLKAPPIHTSAPENAFPIAPNDSEDIDTITRAIYVGTGGNLAVQMAGGGGAVTFRTLPAGALLPIRVTRVLATGTTASDLIGLY